MTTRQPLQPLSPPDGHIVNTGYFYSAVHSANGMGAMQQQQTQTQEDADEVASVVSGLSSLENDADDFERLMIQNERDQRRLHEARHGRPHAFRKARTHPRVGLTIDNLEKNNANHARPDAHFGSPPSSNGSARSDPAIHAPASWGRKARSNRNWMRNISRGEEEEENQGQRTPVPTDDSINGHFDSYQQQPYDENAPHRSIEDSPLSHKSGIHGTPQNDRSQEWDLTFELNEASMIASTPYIPRNTRLDDIRQIEIENLEEQTFTDPQPERPPSGSPKQTRRLRASSTKSVNDPTESASASIQTMPQTISPERKLHARTRSWQSIGKSRPVTGTGKENSPVAMYKSVENIVAVENTPDTAVTTTKPSPPVRAPYRREDSQDLLRRLARVSNTPSPARIAPSRPHTAPTQLPENLSQKAMEGPATVLSDKKDATNTESPSAEPVPGLTPGEPQVQAQSIAKQVQMNAPAIPSNPPPEPEAEAEDVDVTPAPIERPILNPKTPVVTGAWIDTPKPQTIRKVDIRSRSPSKSPRKSSPRKSSPRKSNPRERSTLATKTPPQPEPDTEPVVVEPIRPSLPSSALHALVQEAKASSRRSSVDYGDSTINSLEDLITPLPDGTDGEIEEDTLQGIQLPTSLPRNEAERRRQQEAQQLHSMNAKLRAARTSIRHASRGMQRVEERVDHVDVDTVASKVKVVSSGVQHEVTFWSLTKNVFWHEPTRIQRQQTGSVLRYFGGLTPFTIFLICFTTWGLSELLAWYVLASSLLYFSYLSGT